MDAPDYHPTLSAQLDRFGALLAAVDLSVAVPTCPGWTVAELTVHLGSTHRWVTTILGQESVERPSYRVIREQAPQEPAALPPWFAEGAAALLDTLDSTPADKPVWTFGARQWAGFWPRRMLHEATVHLADVELALGQPPTVTAPIAVDGVEELLTQVPVAALVRRAGSFPDHAVLVLAADDVDVRWSITLDGGDLRWCRGDSDSAADAVVTGTAAQLYLFLWGRLPAPSVTGDADLVEWWSRTVVI